jgi:hypothetical protein
VKLGDSGVHINWAWALSCRIWAQQDPGPTIPKSPKEIGFGQLGQSPNPISFSLFFFFTPCTQEAVLCTQDVD